jgi:hypothetical protein
MQFDTSTNVHQPFAMSESPRASKGLGVVFPKLVEQPRRG